MKARPAEIAIYLAQLSGMQQRIANAVQGIDVDRLQQKTDVRSWSVQEILAHLRSCSDLWTHSIYAMLAEDQPEFSDINERKWAKVTRYTEIPFQQSFLILCLQRQNLVQVLQALPLESWERSAMIFGRTHTVFTQTRRLAKHEQEHLAQIEALLREG